MKYTRRDYVEWGRKGGYRRAIKLSRKRLVEIARQAVKAKRKK